MSAIKHFLLVFDHARNELISQKGFGEDAESAMAEYAKLEEQHRGSSAVDIVLVGSDSIETVKVTHSSYFNGFAAEDADGLIEMIRR